VFPKWDLVVVRQQRPISYTEKEIQRGGMWRFFALVERLVPRAAPRP